MLRKKEKPKTALEIKKKKKKRTKKAKRIVPQRNY